MLPSQVDFSKITFSDIIHDGKYSYVNIEYNKGCFVVNTPIFREIIEVEMGDKFMKCCVMVEDDNFIDFITKLETHMIDMGGLNSHKWFDASTNNWTYRSLLKKCDDNKYIELKILNGTRTKTRITESYDKLQHNELQLSSIKNFNKDYPTRFIINIDMIYFRRNVMQLNVRPVYVEQLILEDYGFSSDEDNNDKLSTIKEGDEDDE